MDEAEASGILDGCTGYVCYDQDFSEVCMDGNFTADELRAVLWGLENKNSLKFIASGSVA